MFHVAWVLVKSKFSNVKFYRIESGGFLKIVIICTTQSTVQNFGKKSRFFLLDHRIFSMTM